MTMQLEEFRARQRAIWAAGDYAELSGYIADVGERVVDSASIGPGMAVLDVACGTGNAARPAARAGARVTGLDLTPELLELGRRKAEQEGLEIEWVERDAEDLPFDDASFDRVLSTFGHMFAPRHRSVADEMMRVCRSGGQIVIATWTPEGTTGDIFAMMSSYMPPPPNFASPPILWGDPDHVRKMFAARASDFRFERHVNVIEWSSVEDFADFFTARFGPLVTAKQMLGDRFTEVRERLVAIWQARNEADDGTLRLPQEYLVSVVHV